MKKLLLGIALLCLCTTFAQVEKINDTIFTVAGPLIKAQVTKVSSSTIHYNYPDEKVVNELETNAIAKIVFANGRVQFFSEEDQSSVAEETIEVVEETVPDFEENSLSILPFAFTKGENLDNDASEIATDYAYEFLETALEKDELVLQETIVTAKRLDEHEIDLGQLQSVDISALRKAVQTEYILKVAIEECTVTQEEKTNGIENSIAIHLKLYNAENDTEIYESATTQNLFAKTSIDTSLAIETSWKNGLESLLQHFLIFKESE